MSQYSANNADIDAVRVLIDAYFQGIHHANIALLRDIFHPDAQLKAPGIRRNLAQWLTLVESREVPANQGAGFDYRVLSIDVINDQAMVKLICPLLGRVYIDFLGLLKEGGCWRIVNKMYTDA